MVLDRGTETGINLTKIHFIKTMLYQNIEVSKRELEVIQFLQTGSNNFWDAYYQYQGRKQRLNRPTWTIATWFNKTIKSIHEKKLWLEIPFVYHSTNAMWANMNGFVWSNPCLNGSKANFECFTLHDAQMEQKKEMAKII
jgi:hypothetical protein